MGSRFNFTLARKADYRSRLSRKGKACADAIRVTKTHIIVGANLTKRFELKDRAVTVTIEKDPDSFALRIRPSKDTEKRNTYRLHLNGTNTNLGTTRPQALFDMPKGSYLEDLKEPGVYVLES